MASTVKAVLSQTLLVGLVVCHQASLADAQDRSSRPNQALFGGAANDPSLRHSLDVTLTASETYDDNNLADLSGGFFGDTARVLRGGFYTGLGASANYAWTGQHAQLVATGGTDVRYYTDLNRFVGVNRFGALGFSADLGPRTRVLVTQSARYTPLFFLYGVLPTLTTPSLSDVVSASDDLRNPASSLGQGGARTATEGAALPGNGYALDDRGGYLYDTAAVLSRGLNSRSSMALLAEYHRGDYNAPALGGGLSSYGVGGRYVNNMSRDMSLHLGYVFRRGQYTLTGARATTMHDVDAGLDYHRSLPLSRRTRVGFRAGSTVVNMPDVDQSGNGRLQAAVVGAASLTHDFQRTWHAGLVYNRGLGFSEAYPGPISFDSVRGSLNGLMGRRIDLSVEGGLSKGSLANPGFAEGPFRAVEALARMRAALHRRWAVFAEYTYLDLQLDSATTALIGIPGLLNRNAITVGVSFWTPLLRR